MPPVSPGGTYLENPQALVDEFLGRLREAEPINTLENSPLMGADTRNVAEIGSIFKTLKDKYEQEGASAALTDKSLKEDLDILFRERQDYLQSLDPSELQPFRQRLADWTKASGLDIGNLNVQDFGGVQHETVSHLLPWQKGYSFDNTPKVIEGYTVPSSPASPLNEFLATEVDRALLSGKPVDFRKSIFSRSGAQRLDNFYRSLGQYAAAMSAKGKEAFSSKELEDPVTGKELGDRLEKYQQAAAASNPFAVRQDPGGTFASPIELPPHLGNVGLQLDEASKLFNWKFVDPLKERFENLGRVQAPYEVSRDFLPSWATGRSSLLSGLGGKDFRELRGLPLEETNYNRLANYGQNLSQYLSGVPGPSSKYGGAANLLFGVDPLGASAKGAVSIAQQNPYGTAGGAALTLLNDEVAKAIAKDDYKGAATAAAKDVLLGAAAEAGLKNVAAPLLQRAAPGVAARVIPAVAGAAQYGLPVAVGIGLLSQGRSGSALDTLVNKAAPVVPGLKPNPKTDIARRTGDAILNEGKYLLRSILQNRVPYLKGRLF